MRSGWLAGFVIGLLIAMFAGASPGKAQAGDASLLRTVDFDGKTYLYQALKKGAELRNWPLQRERMEEALVDYYTGREESALTYFRARSLRGDPLAEMMLAWDQAAKSGDYTTPLAARLKKVEASLSAKLREQETIRLTHAEREEESYFDTVVLLNPADIIAASEAQAAVMLPQVYFHYMSGIMEQNTADAAKTESERQAARNRANAHFETWRQGIEFQTEMENKGDYIDLDVFQLRALAIAKTRSDRAFRKDAGEGLALWEKLETLGLTEAKNRIGLLHLNYELGEDSRPAIAAQKLAEASALGDRNASYNLVEVHALGYDGSPDLKRARAAIDLAASRGNDHGFLRAVLFGEKPETSWSAENEEGDRMTATLYLPAEYPALLKTYARGQDRTGRVLAFKVRYTVGSVGAAQIFPPTNRFNFYSPSPVLVDEGEHVVWVAMSEPAKRVEHIDLRMVHVADQETVLRLRVPVVARWKNEEVAK